MFNTYWSEAIGEDYILSLSSDIMDAYAESRAYGDYEDSIEY